MLLIISHLTDVFLLIFRFFIGGTAKFFGVDEESEDQSKQVWNERRMRLATKRFGGVKEDYQVKIKRQRSMTIYLIDICLNLVFFLSCHLPLTSMVTAPACARTTT